MNYRIAAGFVTLTLLCACQKKDDMAPDANKVVMNITSPRAGQTFRSGDTVFIKATVNYPGELHGYEVKVVDTTTGFIVYDVARHIHDDKFVIDDKWVSSASQPTTLKLSIIAEIDHSGDDARKDLSFQIVP
jgi:hypothetical protein